MISLDHLQQNKSINLQRLVIDIVSHRANVKPVINANSIVNGGNMLVGTVSGDDDIPDLTNWIEEEVRFVLHVELNGLSE